MGDPTLFCSYIHVYSFYLGSFKELKVMEVIGQGTFGVVHRAIWRGTTVAAKILNVPSGCESEIYREIEMCRYVYTLSLW